MTLQLMNQVGLGIQETPTATRGPPALFIARTAPVLPTPRTRICDQLLRPSKKCTNDDKHRPLQILLPKTKRKPRRGHLGSNILQRILHPFVKYPLADHDKCRSPLQLLCTVRIVLLELCTTHQLLISSNSWACDGLCCITKTWLGAGK